jgi:hypothetical protein
MAQSIIHFPPEVMDLVCEYLPRPGLRVLRTASKSVQLGAERVLFRTIYLQFNLTSFERLQKITDHPRICRFVRFLDYDGRQVDPDSIGEGVEKWVQLNAGCGMGLWGGRKEKFMEQFNAEDLKGFYISYLKYSSGQEFLLQDGNARRLLSNNIAKLPGLQGVRYSATSIYKHRKNIPLFQELSPIAQWILQEPDGRKAQELDNFWQLVEPFCSLAKSPQLVSIRGSDLEVATWNKTADTLSKHFQSLGSLRHLSLDFEFEHDQLWSMSGLSKLLAHLPALESLRLSFDYIPIEGTSANLEDFIDTSRPWTSLRKLSLQAVNASDKVLRELLTRHANTLSWLELTHINLREPGHEQTYDDEEGGGPKQGSFLELFQFLREAMSLDHVRFNGNLLNSWDEAWVSPELEYEEEYPYNCLKYRIERFITKGEPFPFRELSDDDKGVGFYGVPFAYEQDDSWQYDDRLLADI